MSVDLTQNAFVGDIIALAFKVKDVVHAAINGLLPETALDNSKSAFIPNFAFNAVTYPGANDPNLNGKPVLVLAVKTVDHTNNNAETFSYLFLNFAPLVVDISGKADKATSATANNFAAFDANGNPVDSNIAKSTVAIKAPNPTAGHIPALDANGNAVDNGHTIGTVSQIQTMILNTLGLNV